MVEEKSNGAWFLSPCIILWSKQRFPLPLPAVPILMGDTHEPNASAVTFRIQVSLYPPKERTLSIWDKMTLGWSSRERTQQCLSALWPSASLWDSVLMSLCLGVTSDTSHQNCAVNPSLFSAILLTTAVCSHKKPPQTWSVSARQRKRTQHSC